MTTGYRELPRGRVSQRAIWPLLGRGSTPLLALIGAVVLVPLLLQLFLWSRVVTVACERVDMLVVDCSIDEVTLATARHAHVRTQGAWSARLAGEVYRSRGDAWIVLCTSEGDVPLTSGFNLAKAQQAVSAEEISRFLLNVAQGSVRTSFGSRWSVAYVFAILFALLLPVTYAFFGQRLRVRVHRGAGVCDIESRAWPLPGERVTLRITELNGFEVRAASRQLSSRLGLGPCTNDGRFVPLTRCGRLGAVAQKNAQRLNAWLQDERESFGTSDDAT